MRKIYFYFVLISSLASCTYGTTWQVLRPADINGIDNIERVTILNRTEDPNKGSGRNLMEGILTGETIGADKRGAEDCTMALRECLSRSENYKTVTIINKKIQGSGRSYMAAPLSWDSIDSLCKQNNAQALIVLEYFDSNSGISTVANGGPIPASSSGRGNANNTVIKTGWRMYVPSSKTIIDEFEMQTWTTYGKNPNGVIVDNYIRKHNVIKGTGMRAGIEYGFRVSEQWINIAHSYFKGGNPVMKQASRYSRAGNWQEAARIWENEANNSYSRKIKSRALHNLAVYHARQGNNPDAMSFAQRAMELRRYGNTMQLMNYLNTRIAQEQRLIRKKSKQGNNDYFNE